MANGGKQISHFRQMLKELKECGCLDGEELALIREMYDGGAINTMWVKQNYSLENLDEDVEVVEEVQHVIYGPYHALYPVAHGASGTIYKAWEYGTDNIVAIKHLRPKKLSFYARERFLREMDLLKSLSHTNILPILAGGEQDGEYFLVTPFMKGGSLEKRLRQLPAHRAMSDIAPLLAIVIQIGKALEFSHAQGIIHRDIKPSNILMDGDHPYLADFGLARKIDQATDLTKGAVGTPCYMASELWQKKVTPKSDIYSMAVMLYEIVTGEYPFPGTSAEQILAKQLMSKPKPPISKDMALPQELNSFILRSLHSQPECRHPNITIFIHELIDILEDGLARTCDHGNLI